MTTGTVVVEIMLRDARGNKVHIEVVGMNCDGGTHQQRRDPSHFFEIEGVEGVGVGIPPGNEEALDFTIDQPGTYTIFCGVPGHREAGMVGELIVER